MSGNVVHQSFSSTAQNFRFTDVLDVALIIGSRSESLLDIAAFAKKQRVNSWEPTHRVTSIGQKESQLQSIGPLVFLG